MKCDGVVAKIFDEEDKIFLFLIDPNTNELKNGINISDSSNIYDKLDYNQLSVVEVVLKDGTEDVDIDIDKFVDGKYDVYDIFIHIKDIQLFSLGKKENEDDNDIIQSNVYDILMNNDFEDVAFDCIKYTKDNQKNDQKESDV